MDKRGKWLNEDKSEASCIFTHVARFYFVYLYLEKKNMP